MCVDQMSSEMFSRANTDILLFSLYLSVRVSRTCFFLSVKLFDEQYFLQSCCTGALLRILMYCSKEEEHQLQLMKAAEEEKVNEFIKNEKQLFEVPT